MFTRTISAITILGLSPIAFLSSSAAAMTFISLNDPSLQGTTLASNQLEIHAENAPPSDPPVAFLDQKVVRNNSGFLDFYYRIIPNTEVLLLAPDVAIAPFGYNDTPVTASNFNVSLLAATDGPGYILPYDGFTVQAGSPSALQYVSFYFGGDAPPPVNSAPMWSLTNTGTFFLIVQTETTDFAPIGFASMRSPDPNAANFTYYNAVNVFAPVPTPEPTTLLLTTLTLPLLLLRLGSRGTSR